MGKIPIEKRVEKIGNVFVKDGKERVVHASRTVDFTTSSFKSCIQYLYGKLDREAKEVIFHKGDYFDRHSRTWEETEVIDDIDIAYYKLIEDSD